MKHTIALCLLFICSKLCTQSITGSFPQVSNQEIVLKGFQGLNEKTLSQSTTDAQGRFVMKYPKEYIGAAVLSIQNAGSLIVILNQENFSIQWDNLQDFNSIKYINSPENEYFTNGIQFYQATEQKLMALRFLLPLYSKDSNMYNLLNVEISKQQDAYKNYISALPSSHYVTYYLGLREILSNLSKKEMDPFTRTQLTNSYNELDFNDDRMWQSGLLKELLEGYYMMLVNESNDSTALVKMNQASDIWIKSLKGNSVRQQEVAELLFKSLEQVNLNGAAEHIALAMLNQSNCQLDDKRIKLFEQYRKLGIGNIAPNIQLDNQLDLKGLTSRYKLLVFGASWCPNCQKDLPSLMGLYNRQRIAGLEIIYISIDSDIKSFNDYCGHAGFIKFCDGKGWNTQAALDYYVSATPTYILLDKDLKILAKFQSPLQFEDWLSKQ